MTRSQTNHDNSSLEYSTMVSNYSGNSKGLSSPILSSQGDLIMLPTDQEFIMNWGIPELVAWPTSES